MSDGEGTVTRAVAVAAVVGQLGAIAVYLVLAPAAERPMVDPLRLVSIAAIYSLPALLAALGLRNRQPLLLAAAIAALVLAVFPFSLHSFVLGPAGIVYAVAYARLATGQRDRRSVIAAMACPCLLVGALLVLTIADHPACYTRSGSGEVADDLDTGCTSDIVIPWEAAASLTLSGAAMMIGLRSVPPSTDGSRGRRVRVE